MKAAIGVVGGAAAFGALIRNIEEAEKATAQLDAAYAATGKTLGRTRSQLDGLATSLQSTTKFSDDLVKEGEAILLTFDKVRGQAFERTIKVAADLSSRLGTDLHTSIRQVGLALQDPTNGLALLRRAGISFSDEQKGIIKGFLETNQAAKAQNLILGELERRFKGSAVAARSTLGGALAGLKNQFGDLFEGSRTSSKAAAEAINELTKALADPQVKSGLDTLIEGSAKLAANFIKAAAAQAQTFKEGFGLGDYANQYTRGGGSRRGRIGRGTADSPAIAQLDEIRVAVRKITDQNGDALRDLEEETRTSVERISADYSRLKAALQTLFDEGKIDKETYNRRLGDRLDEILPEFDLNEIKAKYITLKRETSDLGEYLRGVWQSVGRANREMLSDVLYDWKFSWSKLVDIARRALADIGGAVITSGIKKALQGQLSASGGGGSGGFLKFVGGLFGLAGGGNFDGLRKVGEDGPELVGGRGRVWNQRQLAFAGGGASINYAPTFNLSITSSGDDDRDRQLIEYVDTRISQSQQEFVRTLDRNGVPVNG